MGRLDPPRKLPASAGIRWTVLVFLVKISWGFVASSGEIESLGMGLRGVTEIIKIISIIGITGES